MPSCNPSVESNVCCPGIPISQNPLVISCWGEIRIIWESKSGFTTKEIRAAEKSTWTKQKTFSWKYRRPPEQELQRRFSDLSLSILQNNVVQSQNSSSSYHTAEIDGNTHAPAVKSVPGGGQTEIKCKSFTNWGPQFPMSSKATTFVLILQIELDRAAGISSLHYMVADSSSSDTIPCPATPLSLSLSETGCSRSLFHQAMAVVERIHYAGISKSSTAQSWD